ncbi:MULTISPECIES: O-antigen ligase family protein [unclassified Aerococcus]|uniref:O-antigen ligase family protein n=1 Tax=unclassified Aerococcus TaxID=2618060 RepID=UPI0025C46B77|nr:MULTISPECIES: O-antigen ligase family protein [unclassified Aerococcus]
MSKPEAQLTWPVQSLLISILFISNLFPFYMTLVTFAVIFIFLFMLGLLGPRYIKREVPTSIWIFIAYSTVISFIFQNWAGLGISIAFIPIAIYFNYYQQVIRPYYVEELLNIALIGSFIIFIFATFEYLNWVPEWDYSFISPEINRIHNGRAEATFANPNYYAMMLEFFFFIGLYKMMRTTKYRKKFVFLFISLCNLFAITYTGTRTSLLVVIGTLFVFYFVLGYKKIAVGTFLTATIGTVIAIKLGFLPRFEDLGFAFEDRFVIWEIGLKGLRDNFWFGQGPLTYLNVWQDYGDKYTQHAHNIVLDTLLSYGAVGTGILLPSLISLGKKIHQMRQYPILRRRLALICSFCSIVILHGMFDLTIFWLQTAFLFLFVVLSIHNMYHEVETNPELQGEDKDYSRD